MSNDILTQLAKGVSACKRCMLCKDRKRTVPGQGATNAIAVFIGEGPGENEDIQGLPFVGRSGQFLRKVCRETGGDPAWCFITNVVKCRPPGNRVPTDDEAQACWFWLEQQLRAINPKVIICVGKSAAQRVLKTKKTASMKSLIGQWYTTHVTGRPVVARVIYHPSYILQHGREDEQTMRDDLEEIWEAVRELSGESPA